MDKPDLQSPKDDVDAAEGKAPDAAPGTSQQDQPRADAFGNTASAGSADAGDLTSLGASEP